MKNKLLISILLISLCMPKYTPNINNTRSFQFTYEVEIESTEGKKWNYGSPFPKVMKFKKYLM